MQPSIIFVAALAACAGRAEPARAPAQPQAPLGSTHVAPPGTMPPDTQPPAVITPPAVVRGLEAAARELSIHDETRSHDRIVVALRALADAGARLAPEQRDEVGAICRAADELERSRATSTQHADYTRYGLDAALRLLAAASPLYPMQIEEYMELVRELRRDVDAIDPDAPLLSQHRNVARAFQTAARAMYVAHGAAPPDFSAAREQVPPRGTSLASQGHMKLTDDSFRGRVVISSDGVTIGEIARLLVEPSPAGWRVCSFDVRVRKDAAERVGVHRGLFHGATLEISTDLVQSIGDAVILSATADTLRPPTSPEQPAPPPR